MLPKRHRFSFKKGAPNKLHSTRLFVIRYNKLNSSGLHAAVIVGKKVDKRATVRNKLKRRIVESIKELLPMSLNVDLVIFAKKPILEVSKEELLEEFKKAFYDIHIIS